MGKLTRWQWVAAATVEGLYRLPALALRGAEFLAVWQLATVEAPEIATTDPYLWVMLCSWGLQVVLLPPLALGRLAWYAQLAVRDGIPPFSHLRQGFRRWGAAIRWRGGLWWRQLTALCLAMLPTAAIWGLAHTISDPAGNLLLAAAGGLLLPVTVGGTLLYTATATAPAGLLILSGYPAGAAMGLAPRVIAGHKRAYVNSWGQHLGRLAACLLGLPLPFLTPQLRLHQTAWLTQRLRAAGVTAFDVNPHFLREKMRKTKNTSCKVPQSGVQ